MIELRWLDRRVPSERLHPEMNIYPAYPREKVLQYRERHPIEGAWSEWRDVQTVKEE